MKWRLTSDVLCDKNVSAELKSKFYKVLVRLTMLYETELYWSVKNSHVHKMQVVEMDEK